MPIPRHRAAAAIGSDGRFYVVGGSDLRTSEVGAMDIYEATWMEGPTLPEPIGFVRAATIGNHILVLGQNANSTATVLFELAFDSDP